MQLLVFLLCNKHEWKNKKQGTSWKENLKKDIKECLKSCSSYDEFLKNMTELGYEIKNANISEGKYISFKTPSQEKWIHGRETTLGKEFTRENIMAVIEKNVNEKSRKSDSSFNDRIYKNNRSKVQKYIDVTDDKFQESIGLKIWAERENLKRLAHNYTLLRNAGYRNTSELSNKLSELQDTLDSARHKIATMDKDITSISTDIRYMEQYLKFKPYHDKYRSAKNKEIVFQKYEYELTLFDGAKNILKSPDISLRNITPEAIELLKVKQVELLQRQAAVRDNYDEQIKELGKLNKLNDEVALQLERNHVRIRLDTKKQTFISQI